MICIVCIYGIYDDGFRFGLSYHTTGFVRPPAPFLSPNKKTDGKGTSSDCTGKTSERVLGVVQERDPSLAFLLPLPSFAFHIERSKPFTRNFRESSRKRQETHSSSIPYHSFIIMANDNDDDEEEEEGLSPVSPPQVYQSTGDAERALSLLLLRSSSKNKNTSNTTNNKNPVTQYNLAWLQAMVDGTLPSIRSMETLEQGVLQGSNPTNPGGGATTTTSTTTTTTTSLILTYNRCLSFLAQGKDLPSALRQIYDCLQPIILFSQQQQQQPSTTSTSSSSAGVSGTGSGGDPMYHMVALQLGCLFLEIILIRKAGDDPTEPMEDLGFTVVRENNNNTNIVDAILKWMDMTIERLSIQDEQLQEMYHVMQFTVCLYTARIALAKKKSSSQQQNLSGDNNKGSHPSSSTATIPKQSQFQQQTTTNEHHKVARKELKQALEIFSTKFIKVSNPTNGETASLRSESQGSVLLQLQHPTTSTSQQPIPPSTISTTTTTPVTLPSTAPSTTLHDGPLPAHHHQQQQQQSQSLTSPVSVNLYQAALSLKARTEQLKGNVKKALILCQEAKGSSSTTTTNNVDTSTTTTTTTTSTTALPLPPTNVNKLNKKRTSATTYHPNSTNPTTTTTPAVSGPKNTSTTTSNSTLNPATPVTTMIHENNLAHVYATSGKRYLACHAWSKAVEKGSQTTTILPGTTTVSTTTMMDAAAGGIDTRRMVSKDGTIILPMHFTQANVVWNASMANLMLPEKSNYVSAYQGLASILSSSSSSSSSSNMIPWAMERKRQIRLWLRLGEACLGIHVQQQKQEQTSSANIQGIQVEG